MLSRNSDVDTVVLKDKLKSPQGFCVGSLGEVAEICTKQRIVEKIMKKKFHRLKKISDIRHIVGPYPL